MKWPAMHPASRLEPDALSPCRHESRHADGELRLSMTFPPCYRLFPRGWPKSVRQSPRAIGAEDSGLRCRPFVRLCSWGNIRTETSATQALFPNRLIGPDLRPVSFNAPLSTLRS